MKHNFSHTKFQREVPHTLPVGHFRTLLFLFIGLMLLCTAMASAHDGSMDIFSGHYRTYVSGTPTELTGYQVKLVLYNVSGTNSADTIYLPGIAQPTYNDVRFTLSDDTGLNYWMETPTGTNSAIFWVRVPTIPAGSGNTIPIDIYYGNATTGSAASGDATFPLFDTFDGSSLNTTKWSLVSGTGATISNSLLTMKGNNLIRSNTYFKNNASLRYYANLYGYGHRNGFDYSGSSSTNTTYFQITSSNHAYTFATYANSAASGSATAGTWSANAYQPVELSWNSTYTALTVGTNTPVTMNVALTESLPVFIRSMSSTRSGYYDWLFVRQLADTEPVMYLPATAPAAGFSANKTSGYLPLAVQFTDASTNQPATWAWDFNNDGTIDSTAPNPVYTYTAAGTYTVTLTVTNAAGTATETKTDLVTTTMPSPPVAGFSADTVTGSAPLKVTFSDESSGYVTDWAWDFGDGDTTNATKQNPLHKYVTPGKYTVNLTASNAGGSNSAVKTEYITIGEPSTVPVADFSTSVTSGTAPVTVAFTDKSVGTITSWAWDFNNDGVTDATAQNATYTYTLSGTYTVNLTVAGPGGSNSAVMTDLISVASTNADLKVTGVTSLAPRTVNTVTATLKNIGSSDAGAFKANFTLDGNTTTFDITSLAADGTTTISVTDPVTSRKLGNTVPLTITLDTEHAIAETNETNNVYSTPAKVIRSGSYYQGGRSYSGYDIETGNYTEGHIAVKYALGSGYQTGGGWYSTTAQWTADALPVPTDATIRAARLYQSYTWSDNGNPNFTVQFNGNTVEQVAFYGDGTADNTDVDDYNGQAIYDVTPYFSKTGNTAIINAEAPKGGLYGAVLVVVYENTSEPYRKIWLDEGSDSLNAATTGYAMFGNVTTAGASSAKMTTILPSGGDNAQGSILFNGQTAALKGTGGSDPGYKYYEVTSALQDGTNELGVVCDGYMNLATAILELTYEAPPATSFSANATSGAAPLPVLFTDASYGATVWQWDFNNDGTIDSTDKNPVYTYTAAGTFTVNLTATNAYGSATESKTAYITVTGAEATSGPVVAFSATPVSGTWPLAVQFTDESAGTITARSWDFGDYSTPSAEQNPLHTYTTAGTYNVTLSATSADGTNTTVKENLVTVSPVTGSRLLLTDAKNGTVSGDLYVGSFQPVPFATQPTSDDVTVRDFDQRFAIPTFTNIQWARLYVNVYSGSGSANWPSRTTISLDGNGDGTYET
ncbi:DUF2341 domain-containing protein, partial [Methanoregula sp.]|uniref:DUF2341 domain-containing protein n=1 Tax=Methanoregula sp. TaxID=2052170 RepID=UPI002375C979